MIVKMKKVFLLIQENQAHAALESLGTLGVVHVEHEHTPSGLELNEISEKLSLIEQARSILSSAGQKHPSKYIIHKSGDLQTVCRHIIDLQKRYNQLKEYSVTLNNRIDLWEPWGDFDPAQINALRERNIFIKFVQIPKDKVNNLQPGLLLKKISTQGALVNCLVVAQEDINIGFKELELPRASLSGMKNRLSEDAKIMVNIREELSEYLIYNNDLVSAEGFLLNQKDFYSVLKGMGQVNEITYLKGYIPVEAEGMLFKQAKQNGWGILTLEPDKEDSVPTLVRNPAWIALIRPVLRLLELVPGYREIDISPLFIIFFSLFFGILIGDAGYGAVYLLLTFWVHRKIGYKTKDKGTFFLFYILSFCAIIWGLLTATFFGQEWLLSLGIKPLVPVLLNASFVQGVCFFIGALHLSLAHGWRAALKAPDLSALAEIGWIFIIWAVFFLAKNLLLSESFPSFGSWLIVAGLVLVLFFSSPQKNIFKTLGAGLGKIALSLVNNFTDVVSYIRLFAVGLATVAIADAFNAMAAGIIQKGDFLTIVMAALVIVSGHMLNIILGPMSVLVHGVRLNVLEFCSHANVAWDGFAYKPFCKKEGELKWK
jgi:V/A-type H+-transporting ATPase subunit I